MDNQHNKAMIFNIERASSEDGPGIRTVVFLKGCALRCKWCANPESQKAQSQIIVNPNVCKHCSRCLNICPQKAIYVSETGEFITTDDLCSVCGKCTYGCYEDARSVSGKAYTDEELIAAFPVFCTFQHCEISSMLNIISD